MRIASLTAALLAGAAIVSLTLLSPIGSSAATPSATTDDDSCPVREYAMGIRYQQSAHAAAAQLQSWSIAKGRLRKAIADHDSEHDSERGLAVVTDLDETVLDNSPLLARDLEACHTYTTWDTWSDWEVNGHPTLTPGAADFFRYADRNHVTIYYISDRFEENKASTLTTLRELGLPQVTSEQVLLYGPTKEQRRQVAAADHDVVLLLGDSLPDFHAAFDGATPDRQAELVARYAGHFGRDWIMFPNATYGSWRTSPLKAWDEPLS